MAGLLLSVNPNPLFRVHMVGPVEEPASAFFSLVIMLVELHVLQMLLRLPAAAHRQYTYPATLVTVGWAVSYFWSTAFHTKETKWTERMDYFCAVGLWGFMAYAAVVRVFRIGNKMVRAAILVLLLLYFMRFVYSMVYVLFDYGYAVRNVIVWVALHALLWVPYSLHQWLRHGKTYYRLALATHVCMLVLAPLELHDFVPIWGVFDAHSLWHGGGAVLAAMWGYFLLHDMQHEASEFHLVLPSHQDQLRAVLAPVSNKHT